MSKFGRASAAAAAISLALTGCAYAPVASPNGEGECGGDSVSLSVSQDTVGNNIQIDYTGPSDVSLLLNRSSFYFDFEDYLDALEPGQDLEVMLEDAEPTIVKLNPADSGWTVSSVEGGLVNWAFDGNIDQLLADLPNGYDDPSTYLFTRVFPMSVAVSCDATLTKTLNYADSNINDNTVDGLDIAVAQALFPRHSTIDTVDIINHEIVGGNLIIDFEFAEGTDERFHDFDLGGGFVMIVPLTLEPGTPEISNDTFDGAWFNFVESCMEVGPMNPAFCNYNVRSSEWTFGGTNEWTIPDVSEMVEGEFLGVFFLTDSNDDPSDLRFAFTSFTYDSVNGFAIQDLDTQPRDDQEGLAPTGGDPNVIIFGVVGLLVVLAAFALRPRRREARIDE
jgi:MYXO-CTERM domain-containing protein